MTHDNVTDIEKRLRNFALNTLALIPDKLQQYPKTDPDLIIKGFSHQCDLLTEAADTIATLRKQLENAREALAIRDKSTEPCPADKHHLGDKRCPKCGSSSVGPCWLKVSADSTFVDSAREALKGQPC